MRDGDLVAVGGQPLCDRQPDPPVSAGDQDRTGYECGFAAVGGYVSHPVNLSPQYGRAEIAPRMSARVRPKRQFGSRRLISSAVSPASASTSEPSRSHPTLASPRIVS